ncbi:MAG: AmmeMemoRadiSam system protein B [Chlorobi bacterium]|nr:AmmeMemoRadiSam system protein B [Chlorobiota bacterium]
MSSFSKIFGCKPNDDNDQVNRPAQTAGSFYSDNPEELTLQINDLLRLADEKIDYEYKDQTIRAIAVPHAGYAYSAHAAAYAYLYVKDKDYDAVIIIGPSHRKAFSGASVFSGDAYLSPLGAAKTDKELAVRIAEENSSVRLSLDGHDWKTNEPEHSIEVQIPFLQVVLPDVPIVPICIGTQDNKTIDGLMKAIVNAVRALGKNVLIVASTDLSHFHNEIDAAEMDEALVYAFDRYDYFKINLKAQSDEWEACGAGPLVCAMEIAEQISDVRSQSLIYTNSARSPLVQADSNRVVGYFAGVIAESDAGVDLLPNLTDEEKSELLKIAENTVKESVRGQSEIDVNYKIPEAFKDEYAVFVTLRKKGELRGCIGYTIARNSLYEAVSESAHNAAMRDTRFSPVSVAELDDITYEVTILSNMHRVLDPNDVVAGRDGVLLRNGYSSGLFLPQVATEQNWSRQTLLEQIGRKAGMNTNAYLLPETELFVFRAMIVEAE